MFGNVDETPHPGRAEFSRAPEQGRPRDTYFSRRKLVQPSPPSAASTRMRTSSTNFMTGADRSSRDSPAIKMLRARAPRHGYGLRD